MNILSSAWTNHWNSISEMLNSVNLQIVLLIGSGLLAVALLVLSLTRWGQARPVWKCVVLSVVAHILLMGYAYGTHLIFKAPQVVEESTPMRINVVDREGQDLVDNEESNVDGEPWNELTSDVPMPGKVDLERPLIDSTLELERTVEMPQPQIDAVPTPIDDPFELTPELLQEQLNAEKDRFQHPPMEIESAPQEIGVARRVAEEESAVEGPAIRPITELARGQAATEPSPWSQPDRPIEESEAFLTELRNEQANVPSAEPLTAQQVSSPMAPVKERASSQMRLIRNPRRLADGKPIPRLYSQRAATNRLAIAKRRGGSIETERAVKQALRWLAMNQESDGRWNPRDTGAGRERSVYGHDRDGAGAKADTGITALAILAFLANGQSHFEGPHKEQIQKGLEFLAASQARDGNLAGDAKLFARMYCHSMALLAISEALALTGDERLLPVVQSGVNYTVHAQHRTDGGWRYQPGDTGDMSQFGWQVMALHSAKLGGAIVPDSTFQRMEQFLNRCTMGVGKGLASYRPGQQPSTTMTAEALVCRYFLKQDISRQTVDTATRRVLGELPSQYHINHYYWYYGTMAMFNSDSQSWKAWNQPMKVALLTTQVRTGDQAGSWAPEGLWAGYGGRVYSTATAALCLQVYYRYLPVYEVAQKGAQPVFR